MEPLEDPVEDRVLQGLLDVVEGQREAVQLLVQLQEAMSRV